MTDSLERARQIYVDANVRIYLVEGAEPFQSLAQRALSVAAESNIELVSSELSYAECLYGAFKTSNRRLETFYRRMFSASGLIHTSPVDLAVLERAAKLGGASGLKLLDSIHMTTAIQTGCDVYLTNDKRFSSVAGLRVVQLQDAAA